ncbi:MAG: 16S rRNA (cytidine(1402)-2'-O)-methyltransferase [Parcubacteria group bacterium]
MDTGILYIVATPIGNLDDITLRALETLKKVDLVACEDTRVTKKLLDHYAIKKPATSYFQHSKAPKISQIMEALKSGQNVALVTDAGTPGVSDPGNKLVEEVIANNICVISIPGASALTALASVAGIDMQKFVFLGFPPHKKGRETFFKEVIAEKYPVIYYESPHRVIKNLELLKSLGGEKNIILGRELTKMFEEIVRGNVDEVLKYFQENPGKVKGEFTIIVY